MNWHVLWSFNCAIVKALDVSVSPWRIKTEIWSPQQSAANEICCQLFAANKLETTENHSKLWLVEKDEHEAGSKPLTFELVEEPGAKRGANLLRASETARNATPMKC